MVLLGFHWGHHEEAYTAEVLLASQSPSERGAGNNEESAEHASGAGRRTLTSWALSEAIQRDVQARLAGEDSAETITCEPMIAWLPAQELAVVRMRGRAPGDVVEQANAYGAALADVLTAWRDRQFVIASEQVRERLSALDTELERASRGLMQFNHRASEGLRDGDPLRYLEQAQPDHAERLAMLRLQLAELDRKLDLLLGEIRKLTPALVAAREALAQALQRLTEEHPRVKELRANLAAVEARMAALNPSAEVDVTTWGTAAAVSLYAEVIQLRSQKITLIRQIEELNQQAWELERHRDHLPARHVEFVQFQSRYQALKDERFRLAGRLEHLTLDHAAAAVQVLKRASLPEVAFSVNPGRGLLYGAAGGIVALLVAGLVAFAREWRGGRIRDAIELRRATGLPVIASLDDLNAASAEVRLLWGTQTLALIRHRIGCSPLETFVCGITSLATGAGRSVLIATLADAAEKMGYRVLTIPPPVTPCHVGRSCAASLSPRPRLADDEVAECQGFPRGEAAVTDPAPSAALALTQGGGRTEDIEAWRQAVQQWDALERCLVLVKLPPISTTEGFLLAEQMPHLIWVGRNGGDRDADTRIQFTMLNQLRFHWVGAVYNRVRSLRLRRRWGALAGLALLVGGLTAPSLQAQFTNEPPADLPDPEVARPGVLAVSGPEHLADWQKRLTLGPGDTFSIYLYEQPDTAKSGIFIGPDGRINYLEARDFLAAGLTVDELRAELEEVLAKYRLSPRVVINPISYASKKYYLLGNVNQKGVFLLDRPVTIIEAIARSGGFVTSQSYRNSLTQADLGRSFLIRRQVGGTFGREVVDFEALFQRGDLSHNIPLTPDDYLFFPPLDLQEVYVLGEVRGPGLLPYGPELTALGAIIAKGGFTERAFKSRVLIVRGSLNRPQTFVVNTADILAARGPDFPLSNRDIVYVHRRPFVKAEELLESAVLTFARSFVTAWAGQRIGPFITEPLVE